jgi:hypothetical protein
MYPGATATASDARHLAWLRDETGEAFTAGIVFHAAAPVSALGSQRFHDALRLACAPRPRVCGSTW